MSNDITSLAKMNLSALQQTTLETQGIDKKSSVKDTAKVQEAAEQFEAIFLQQMIDSMWSSLPNDGLLSGSNEEAMYRDMFNQAISEEMAKTQSLGIKDIIMKEMEQKK